MADKPPWGPVVWGPWQPGGFRIGLATRRISRIRLETKTYLQRRYLPLAYPRNARHKPWVPPQVWAESA